MEWDLFNTRATRTTWPIHSTSLLTRQCQTANIGHVIMPLASPHASYFESHMKTDGSGGEGLLTLKPKCQANATNTMPNNTESLDEN